MLLLALLACNGDTQLNKGDAELVLDPAEPDFGEVVRGATADLAITLHNDGYGVLAFDSVTLDPLSSGAFSIVSTPTQSIGYQEDGEIVVRYAPTAEGLDRGALVLVPTDDEQQTIEIPIQGLGVAPHADVDPETLDFGQVTVGGSVTLPVVVYAAGTGTLSVDAFQFPGGEAVAYALELDEDWTFPKPVDSGTSFTFRVTFAPPSDAPWPGELWIDTNDPDDPYTVVRLYGNREDTGPNEPPEVEILDPNDGDYLLDDAEVALRGQVVDDGPLDQLVCAWYAGSTVLAAALPDAGGLVETTSRLPVGDLDVTLRCIDGEGASGEDTASVTVWPADGPFYFTLSGGESLFDWFSVDDDITIYLGSEVLYEEHDGTSSTLPPLTFEGNRGDVVRIVVTDQNACSSRLDPLFLHFGADRRMALNDEMCVSACADDACYDGSYEGPWPGISYDASFPITLP